MKSFLKGIHDDQEFFVINFVVNLNKKNFTRPETN